MRWLQSVIEAGKRVVITSDMYLPREFFEHALVAHGVGQLPLYVSADRNATKRDFGELFDLLAAEQGVAHANILHIGDNPTGDVQRAKEKGLQVHHYVPAADRALHKSASLASSIAHGLLQSADRAEIQAGSFEEFGYLYGGPAMVGFLEWIKEQSLGAGFEHVLFLARDGFLLDRIAREHSSDGLPPFLYFMGSRTAYSLAAMTDENFDAYFPFLLSGSMGLSPSELLERIGVPAPAPEFLENFGLGDDVVVSHALLSRLEQFIKFYRWEILKVCRRNRRALYQYLRHADIKDGARIALVDVGWRGTTQEAFEIAIKPFMDLYVTGLYFCLAQTEETQTRMASQKMMAMIRPNELGKSTVNRIYEKRLAVEMCFSAPHHSVLGLLPGIAGIEPVYDPGRGDTGETTLHVRDILKGVEKFAADFYSMQRGISMRISPKMLIQPLIEYITQQEGDSFNIFERVKNFDAWGSSKNLSLTLKSYAP
jgi:predicted HAD superfamily hydrolase